MPHKHTRKGEDKDTVDLPPSVIAKPLSTSKSAASNGVFTTEVSATRKNSKRKRNADNADDTPKAFARLMAFTQGKKLPKGLDDGVRQTKKQKKDEAAKAAKSAEPNAAAVKVPAVAKVEMPTIRPGEKMSDFSARVDAALPISGLMNKTARGGKDPLGLKVHRTKKEKKMHKMYDEWREQDKKIKDARLEALELAEEEDDDDESAAVKWKVDNAFAEAEEIASGKKKGKGKKKKMLGEVDDGDDDPWAAVQRARNEKPIGLHDVAQAPPTFSNIPKEKFKVKGGAKVEVGDVPKASGSLRRREELGAVRAGVIEGYRQMMKSKQQA